MSVFEKYQDFSRVEQEHVEDEQLEANPVGIKNNSADGGVLQLGNVKGISETIIGFRKMHSWDVEFDTTSMRRLKLFFFCFWNGGQVLFHRLKS